MDPDEVVKVKQSGMSLLAGMLFAAGWWCFIDGYNYGTLVVKDPLSLSTSGYAWVPLFGATLFFCMINGMKWSELSDEAVMDPRTSAAARIFLIVSLFIAFACVAGAVFIVIDFVRAGAYQWAGISSLVGTLIIIMGAFVMRFGTLPVS